MNRERSLYTQGNWMIRRKDELADLEDARPCRTISTSLANIRELMINPTILDPHPQVKQKMYCTPKAGKNL